MHIRHENRDKVDAKSMKGIFLGYEAKLVESFCASKNIKKRLDFSIRAGQWYDNVPRLEPQKAENHDEHIVMLPEGGQPLNTLGVHGLMNNAENRAVHGQQPI